MGMDPHMDPSQQDPHQAQNQVGQDIIMFTFLQLTNIPLCRHNPGTVSQASSRATGPRGPAMTPCVPLDMDHQCRLSEYYVLSPITEIQKLCPLPTQGPIPCSLACAFFSNTQF